MSIQKIWITTPQKTTWRIEIDSAETKAFATVFHGNGAKPYVKAELHRLKVPGTLAALVLRAERAFAKEHPSFFPCDGAEIKKLVNLALNEPKSFTIKEGMYCRDEAGGKVGPMRRALFGDFVFVDGKVNAPSWTLGGQRRSHASGGDVLQQHEGGDLVGEWVEAEEAISLVELAEKAHRRNLEHVEDFKARLKAKLDAIGVNKITGVPAEHEADIRAFLEAWLPQETQPEPEAEDLTKPRCTAKEMTGRLLDRLHAKFEEALAADDFDTAHDLAARVMLMEQQVCSIKMTGDEAQRDLAIAKLKVAASKVAEYQGIVTSPQVLPAGALNTGGR